MKVGALKPFLNGLVGMLEESQGKGVAKDVARISDGLTPFSEMTAGDFADFLIRAEEYHRTGILASRPGRRTAAKAATAASPEAIKEAAQRVMNLYERFADAGLGYQEIDAEMKRLDKELTKDGAIQLLHEIGIAGKPKTKKAAIDEIKRKIVERKASFQSVQSIGGAVRPAAELATAGPQ